MPLLYLMPRPSANASGQGTEIVSGMDFVHISSCYFSVLGSASISTKFGRVVGSY